MYRKGSTLYPAAKKEAFILFAEGLKPAEVYRNLKKRLKGTALPRDVRYVYRWLEEWRTKSELAQSVKAVASDKLVQAKDGQEPVQEYVPARKAGLDLLPAPSLPELIAGGVPRDYAPRLLLDWDIAFDNGENYRTHLFSRILHIYGEFRDIPWDRAINLASLDLSYEIRHNESAGKVADLTRRYRPWEGNENLLAFRRRAEYLKLVLPTEKPGTETDIDKEQKQPPMNIRP
jgi:hypothetical protein